MNTRKIDPTLLSVLDQFETEGKAGLSAQGHVLGIDSGSGTPRPPSALVFLHCNPDDDLSDLRAVGADVHQGSGTVRTATVPLVGIDFVSEDARIHRIVASRRLRLLDTACAHVHIPGFRNTSGMSGMGVVVGVVDSGIDSRHPAFAGRILRIWDQTLTGAGVPEGAFGVELSGNGLAASRDVDGHGTHVAGIAAGRDAVFGGVAPDATLVVVKTTMQDAHIAAGVRYIMRLATDLNMPAVVNISLGGHGDAHDGTDSLSMLLDGETGAGRIVCCAAGNEGNDNIHGQAMVAAGATHSMRFRVPPNAIGIAALNGWYPGASQLEVRVRTPAGFVTPFQPIITAGNPARLHTTPQGPIRVTTPAADPSNGDVNFFVELLPVTQGAAVTGGVWRLEVRNTSQAAARLDVWTLDDHSSPPVAFSGTSVSDAMKIGSPGSSRSAITVASFTTKVAWTDLNGNQQQVGLRLHDISDFSSEGPLRSLIAKPDVAAPGAMLVSALSAHSGPRPEDLVAADFLVMAGTSMATPFVTGLVALLLQRDGTLTPAAVKTLMASQSRIPNQPAGTFDPKWGLGLVDALNL
jgi:subtilisin family serine protease